MEMQFDIVGGDFTSAGTASSEVKSVLKSLGVTPMVIRKIAVALYESEVNVVAHAFRGKMFVKIESDAVFVRIEDEGPGIEDIDKAMEEGFSTASDKVREMGFGAGMGLPNIKRNTDEMVLSSVPGQGTVLKLMVKFS